MTLLLLSLGAALAHSAGMAGDATTGCSCHGGRSSGTVGPSFTTSATTVAPGDVVSVSFIVTSSVAGRDYAGLDVSATGGTFTAGSNTATMGSDITHTAATAMAAGAVTFDMSWTAPAAEGTYSLQGAALAVNHDGSDGGDAWNLATDATILVDDGCDDLDGDGYEACDDGTGADCDDDDAATYPGASEYCDDIDNDCDGSTDESSAVDAETWYLDGDGDGWGLSTSFTVSCDVPAGYVADDTDCNDGDGAVFPTATELCNGLDDDCDGSTDPSTSDDATTWYQDADADGYAGTTTTMACTLRAGFLATSTDCNDALPAINPGAVETCDGVDQDCDGAIDEDAADRRTYYADGDADGFGDAAVTTDACTLPAAYALYSGDCDDSDATFHPGATELCTDSVDYNCDGSTAAVDLDADGYVACTECDDGDASIHPGATELCNGVDDDCDGAIDPDSAADASAWFTDADADGYGDAGTGAVACLAPAGTVADATDCDDADPTAFPSAPETCDHVDDDCDGVADDSAAGALTWYADADADGYGDVAATTTSCWQPAGYLADATDCDDTDAASSPAASESCDGVDDDCDGTVDEPDAIDASIWYADADADGYGDPLNATLACDAPSNFVADSADCDDAAASVNPSAAEVWYDGVDDNCDGNDADSDLDGWLFPGDCDDEDATVNPDAVETFYDGVDADCSGNSDFDADGDGSDSESYGGSDCDDADPTTYVGAPDLGDGVEHNCDVRNDHDRDDDGYDDVAFGGEDCDDADSSVSPAANDDWYDGVDSDCDGSDDYDQDHDGVTVDQDCDDTDRSLTDNCDTGGADTADTGDSGVTDTGDLGGGGAGNAADTGIGDNPACAGCASGASTATLGGLLLMTLATLRRRR